MTIKNGKDFWAGLMFLAFGLGFMFVAMNNYAMGTAVRMGPAYFPTMLGGLQAVLGLIILLRSVVSRHTFTVRTFAFRPVWLIVGLVLAVVAYFIKEPTAGGFLYNVAVAVSIILITASFGPPHLYIILSTVVIFAYLLKPIGLYLATILMVVLSRSGRPHFTWPDAAKSVVFALVALGVFLVAMKFFGLFLTGGWPMTVATVVMIPLCIYLGARIPGMELGSLCAVLGIFSISVFVFGLGLTFPVCPEPLDDACRLIGLGK